MRLYLLNTSMEARLGWAREVNAHHLSRQRAISAFASREFGLEENCQQKTYIDTQAVMVILNSTQKPILTESPFVKNLYNRENNERYWNRYHMILQLEGVVDCLQMLHPEFKLVIVMFDHSQGRTRKRNGALNAMHMSSKDLGQGTMISQSEEILRHRSLQIKVGDNQSFIMTCDISCPNNKRSTNMTDLPERSSTQQPFWAKQEFHSAELELQEKQLHEIASVWGIGLYHNHEQIMPGWEG